MLYDVRLEYSLLLGKILRERWGQGYRKCCRCQQMYLAQNNYDDSCTFIDQGFSPSEGSYRHTVVSKHVQAKAQQDKYNEHVKDIRMVGGISRKVGLGSLNVAPVEFAKTGGALGMSSISF